MAVGLEVKEEKGLWDRATALFDQGILPDSSNTWRRDRNTGNVGKFVEEGEDLVSRVVGVKALSDEELRQRSYYDGQIEQGIIDVGAEIVHDKYRMDLRWATGFYQEISLLGNLFINGQTGIRRVEGFGYFPAYVDYRHNGRNINDLFQDPVMRMAHELVHIARWPIMEDKKRADELFAYNAGTGTLFGKLYALLLTYNIYESEEKYAGFLLEKISKLPFGKSNVVLFPAAIFGAVALPLTNPFVNGHKLVKANRTFNHVQQDLITTFGPEDGRYIFGRLEGHDLEYIGRAKPDLKEYFAGQDRMRALDSGYGVKAQLFRRRLGVTTELGR